MKRWPLVLCLLASATALAQGPSPLGQLERFEADLRAQSFVLKRDANIVAQVMIGIGELRDFQQNAAIQKALDRIEAAQLRAGERPPGVGPGERPSANRGVQQILASMRDDLIKARQQGAMADMSELQRTLAKRARDLRAVLFRELDEIRRGRQILADLQTRVARLTTEVDDAMAEALGSAFDYVRAAGD